MDEANAELQSLLPLEMYRSVRERRLPPTFFKCTAVFKGEKKKISGVRKKKGLKSREGLKATEGRGPGC